MLMPLTENGSSFFRSFIIMSQVRAEATQLEERNAADQRRVEDLEAEVRSAHQFLAPIA